MKNNPLVSIIIPTYNNAKWLNICLPAIKKQNYQHIEILIIDGESTDETRKISQKYGAKVYTFKPLIIEGVSDAPHKRNYGVERANGKYIYYLDADMELKPEIIEECVNLCEKGYDAVIIPEDSVGEGIWARAKNLERRCYWGDDSVEAPRFIRKSVWDKLGGLDLEVGGGGDDWDFYQKLKDAKYKVARSKSILFHHEGRLSLIRLMKKRFIYGRQSLRYIRKRPVQGFKSYFPIRLSFLKNWKLFISRPIDAFAFIFMRFLEYLAGFSGILSSLITK